MQNWNELIPKKIVALGDRPGEGLTYQRIWAWVSYPDVQPVIEEKDEEGNLQRSPALWWTPACRGFRAKILTNPMGGQVRREQEALRAYGRGDMKELEYLTSLADRVTAWEYRVIMEDGSVVDIPAPADGGSERFYDLPADLMLWLVGEIRTAHLPKAKTSVGASAGPTDTAIPTQIGPEPEVQTS